MASADQEEIPGFLGRVRLLLFQYEARRAVLYALAGIAALVLVLPWLGLLLGANRPTALAVLGTAGMMIAVGVAGAVLCGYVRPRRRFARDRELARWVGTRREDVASDLLSAVELVEAPPRPGAPSTALVEALVEATSYRLETVEPASLFDRAPLGRARSWAIAAIAANALLLLVAPRLVGAGWRALVAAPPAPLTRAELSAIPLVGDLEVTLEFPAYSRKPKLTLPSSSGDVHGLPGTKVTLRARVLVPARAVELVIEADDRPADAPAESGRAIPVALENDQLVATLVIEREAKYRFAVVSPHGRRSIEAVARAIEAEPDQAPVVQLMAPAEPLDVTNLRRVELAYVLEDDFGLASAELVWEAAGAKPHGGAPTKDRGRKPIPLPATGLARTQGKVLWDIAEIEVPSGGEVRYWLEAKDNDNVEGANIGKSRELHLKVISPRERHEETLGRHQEVAEKLLKNLGGRLTLSTAATDDDRREELAKQLHDAVIELGAVAGAFEKDPHASEAMRKALVQMRERLDKLTAQEQRLLPGKPKPPAPARPTPQLARGALVALDARMIAELEEDVLVLVDWLDRERLEGVLDISDEIASHQKRLADLLKQYEKTKDARLLDEIEREMKALDRAYAELDKQRRGMPEDVLDQYVHDNAAHAAQGTNCLDAVRQLVRAGKTVEAQQKLESCRSQHGRSASALESSLASLRGDRFGDEQKKLDEVMNELSDLAKDQEDIAAEADRLFQEYVRKADEVAKDNKREASKKVGGLVDKLRRRLKDIDESGLTPFAKEELDIVERRLTDVETMVGDGDLAEALGMAQQAKQSLDTIAGELQAAYEDDPKSKWAAATQDALDDIKKAQPLAKELIKELQALSPKPDQIMSRDDLRAMDRLRRREAMNKARAQRLAERTKQLGDDLPGDAAQAIGKKLGGATGQMQSAEDRMKARDPSGAREAARAAADALAKARDRAKSAARQAQEGAISDEPIRIPGADEYRAPEKFREDLLEAMKKKTQGGPDGYNEQIKRYYEELIK